ncbi:MAG: 1-deoxy-D-xylulose-5-phosphate reductoisomerase [Verrucomicrobiota bacterium]
MIDSLEDSSKTAPRNVVILGATGSIGSSALEVIRKHPDALRLVGASAHTRIDELAAIQREFSVENLAYNEGSAEELRRACLGEPTITAGTEGLISLATLELADVILVALVGTAGLEPTLAAIRAKKTIALANKEVLVMAGKFVMQAAKENGVEILPVDSEHNALFQCLEATQNPAEDVASLVLTASGGAFRDLPLEDLKNVTVSEALKHPNWEMGPKVTIDSATMANKGLEIIEAHWLYGFSAEQIEVTTHTESIVHSLIKFQDGSVLAQLCPPSMTFPIQYCLLYPQRRESVQPTLDFKQPFSLNFRAVDFQRYPCLELAYSALRQGGIGPTVFNAANEIAVEAFVAGQIAFLEISTVIQKTMKAIVPADPSSLSDVLDADKRAREIAASFIPIQTC